MMNAATETSIVIRDIETKAEMCAVEELQKEVWGVPDLDVVPLTQLTAAKAAGGVLLGAFDGARLIGFVYGFVAQEEHGQIAHHSHMLAVKSEYRNFALGYRLKSAQRERVLAQGIEIMSWTFDPLQSLNAYLNFNKLGVISDRYLINFYGEDAASFLHQTGTDRLWVTWLLSSRRVKERHGKTISAPEFEKVKTVVEVGEDDAPRSFDFDEKSPPERIEIEIPTNISELEKQSRDLAIEWRTQTRKAFTKSLAAGYLVEDFYLRMKNERQCGFYLLNYGRKFEDFD